MRIAMWSGPRNLSTAMMYAFGNRADLAVVDEPFYASYLSLTGLNHPMRDEILKSQDTNAGHVAASLVGEVPGGKPHFYQKHMTQHMIEGVRRDWMSQVANVFLIRHPARVVASFGIKYDNPTLEDIGFRQQADLFDEVLELGQDPVVLDSADIRNDPEGVLKDLCRRLALDWDPAMLDWPKGGHKADGIWAAHWYGSVHDSTGFAGPEGPLPELSGAAADLVERALPYYHKLEHFKI